MDVQCIPATSRDSYTKHQNCDVLEFSTAQLDIFETPDIEYEFLNN